MSEHDGADLGGFEPPTHSFLRLNHYKMWS